MEEKRRVFIPREITEEMPATVGIYLKTFVAIDGSTEETIFVLKEKDIVAPVLIKMPCQIKHGLFQIDQVLLVVVMFYIWNTIYEIWWNYYETDGEGTECFGDIATQDYFRIFFVTEKKRILGGTQRKNELKETFRKYLAVLKKATAWSMRDFDRAKEEMYRRFPSKESLWKALVA